MEWEKGTGICQILMLCQEDHNSSYALSPLIFTTIFKKVAALSVLHRDTGFGISLFWVHIHSLAK